MEDIPNKQWILFYEVDQDDKVVAFTYLQNNAFEEHPSEPDPEFEPVNLTITSSGIVDGVIDDVYALGYKGISLPISWSPTPDGTKSFVVLLHDLDSYNYLHWLVVNIPTKATSLVAGASNALLLPEESTEVKEYWGPYHDSGETHRYQLVVLAIDATLDKELIQSIEEDITDTDELLLILKEHAIEILGKGTLTGTFTYPDENKMKAQVSIENTTPKVNLDSTAEQEIDLDSKQEAVREPEDEADVNSDLESDTQDYEPDAQDNPDTSNDPNLALEEEEIKEDISF